MATAPQAPGQRPGQQPDPDLQTGIQYLRAGWFDRAEPLFRAAHTRYGDRPDLLHFLAVCLSQRGALGEAADLWRKAIARDPKEAMLTFNLGIVTRRMGLLDEAAKNFRDTIRRAPTHVEARLALAGVHIDQGKFTAAERELVEVASNLDRAIEHPDGANLRPVQARTRNMLGHVLYRLTHYGPAIEVLDMALNDAGEDAGRRAQILGDRALALNGLGHHDEAIAEAGKALALAPENGSINHVMGFVLYFAGKVSDALPPIQKALDLGFTPALRTLALAQAAAGKTDDAVATLQRAIRQNPRDRDAVLQLSLLHIEKEQFEPALAALDPYLKAMPDDIRALNNRGLALRGLKRFEEAQRSLKRASRLATDDPFVLTNLGRVLVDLGRAAEALPLHEHALRVLPGHAALLTHYGICLLTLGNKDRARETLDAALAADPDSQEALAARTSVDA
ncbi:MAG: tetratricopeptide repeat protein [Proteobacteria bacterium]|nr:tetratricopeptide repeat protein [Pseudomonadota bacterium]